MPCVLLCSVVAVVSVKLLEVLPEMWFLIVLPEMWLFVVLPEVWWPEVFPEMWLLVVSVVVPSGMLCVVVVASYSSIGGIWQQ